jgi:hypothetical protein
MDADVDKLLVRFIFIRDIDSYQSTCVGLD